MSPREKRLRERIDRQSDKIDRLERRIREGGSKRSGRATRRCVYCGRSTVSGAAVAACLAHHQLVSLDPHYSEAAYA